MKLEREADDEADCEGRENRKALHSDKLASGNGDGAASRSRNRDRRHVFSLEVNFRQRFTTLAQLLVSVKLFLSTQHGLQSGIRFVRPLIQLFVTVCKP